MRLFIKLLLFFVVLALAAPFFMKKPDGSPMLTLQSIGLQSVVDKVAATKHELNVPKTAQVYRWQDEHGVWHYSDQAQTSAAEKHQVNISQNRLKHLEVASETDKQADSAAPTVVPERASLGDVPQLLKQVEQIKQTAEQRNRVLDAQ
jgi:hypothetical protein